MNGTIETIPLMNLALVFIPALFVIAILFKWSLDASNALYAVSRMLVQLMLIGYFLAYIFESDSAGVVLIIMMVMVVASSWIALGTIADRRMQLYRYAFISLLIGGGFTLLLVTQGVLVLDPWYSPQSMIPIAGMIFANAMNSVSLAAERLDSEIDRSQSFRQARNTACRAPMRDSPASASAIVFAGKAITVVMSSLTGCTAGRVIVGASLIWRIVPAG